MGGRLRPSPSAWAGTTAAVPLAILLPAGIGAGCSARRLVD